VQLRCGSEPERILDEWGRQRWQRRRRDERRILEWLHGDGRVGDGKRGRHEHRDR